MEIRLLDEDKNKLNVSFIIKGYETSFVNAVRRLMMDNVPTLAIEDIEFRKNSSILYDEIVAHRLGLLPIKTDLKSYELPSVCSCKGEGCAKCQLKMTLSGKTIGTVYAGDIKSKDSKCVPVYKKMPIVKLFKGQAIELEAVAKLGQGKEHSKWVPAHVFFRNSVNIVISGKCNDIEKCVKACPKQILINKNGKLAINKENLFNCDLCQACVNVCPKGISINSNKDEFIFNIESWGQLPVKEIGLKAADLFKEKIDNFEKAVNEGISK